MPLILALVVVSVATLRRRVGLIADDRAAQCARSAADGGSCSRVVVDLIADDGSRARAEGAAGKSSFFTAAERPRCATSKQRRERERGSQAVSHVDLLGLLEKHSGGPVRRGL